MNIANKKQSLQKIADEIVANKVCYELASQATQLVFGDGNMDAEIVFIGEAPGKKEDETGLPFVGAAGKFLNEMLGSIDLKREDVYITNIVKYRPPGNRDPLPEEKKAFWPYLVRQLDVIKPKLVITLGRHAKEYFLPDRKISQVHGMPKRIKMAIGHEQLARDDTLAISNDSMSAHSSSSIDNALQIGNGKSPTKSLVILPLYHPAAALYNGGQRQMLMDDFAKIPQILEAVR